MVFKNINSTDGKIELGSKLSANIFLEPFLMEKMANPNYILGIQGCLQEVMLDALNCAVMRNTVSKKVILTGCVAYVFHNSNCIELICPYNKIENWSFKCGTTGDHIKCSCIDVSWDVQKIVFYAAIAALTGELSIW